MNFAEKQKIAGKPKKGQVWNDEKKAWEYPAGYVAPNPSTPKVKKTRKAGIDLDKLTAEITARVRAELAQVPQVIVKEADKSRSIPDSDLLEKPKFYWAYGAAYILGAYRFKGSEITPPYSTSIKFNAMPPIKLNDGKDVIPVCMTAAIWGKKECEFIENSPAFKGGLIMEKQDDANIYDFKDRSNRIEIINFVERLNLMEVKKQLSDRNLKAGASFEEMKDTLIASLITDRKKQLNNFHVSLANRHANEALLNR